MVTWRNRRDRATPIEGETTQTLKGSLAVDLSVAVDHLRVDPDSESAYIQGLIESVQSELEPPNGWLGRALTTSEYRLSLPYFARRIVVPAPPLVSVDAVTYLDHNGDEQTVGTDVYRVTDEEPAEIVLNPGKSWPADVAHEHDAVRIAFTAGYGAAADVPAAIREYILLMVAHRFENREAVRPGTSAMPMPYIRDMLESWRVR